MAQQQKRPPHTQDEFFNESTIPTMYARSAWKSYEAGDYDRAISEATSALQFDPKYAAAYRIRGSALMRKEEYAQAIDDWNEAIRLAPNFANAIYNRALARMRLGDYEQATADYREAIGLDPQFAEAYNLCAWLQATCPDERYRDGNQALVNATKGCELSDGTNGLFFGTLAAAYAETGNFEEAIKWQTKANDLYSKSEKTQWGFLLDLYRQGKVYRGER